MYGMKLSDLTDAVLAEIIRLYDKTVGGNGRHYPETTEYVRRTLEGYGTVEWRFGSRVTEHSKLWVEWVDRLKGVIRFSFDANAEKGKTSEEEVRQLEQSFEQAVDELLTNRGLVV